MNQLRKIVMTMSLGLMLVMPLGAGALAYADDPTSAAVSSVCSSINNGSDCNATSTSPVASIVRLIINILSVLIGVVAVIMVIYNGFRFVVSGGDSSKVASARSGILYAIVGIVVAALAQILVHFVIFQVDHAPGAPKSSETSGSKHPVR